MTAKPGYIDGSLEWTRQAYLLTSLSPQAYLLTTLAIRHWDFSKAKNSRVRDVAKHIRDTGRFQYDMSCGGSGCIWNVSFGPDKAC